MLLLPIKENVAILIICFHHAGRIINCLYFKAEKLVIMHEFTFLAYLTGGVEGLCFLLTEL